MKKLIVIFFTFFWVNSFSQSLVTVGMTSAQFKTAINSNLRYLVNHIDPEELFDTLQTSTSYNQLYRLNNTWKKLSGYVGTTLTDSIYYGQKGVNMRLAINTNFQDLYDSYDLTKNTFIYIKPTVTSLTNVNIAKVYSNSSNEQIYRSTDGVNFTLLGSLGTSYNDATVEKGQLYYYRAVGEGKSSNVYKIAVIPAYTFSTGQSIAIPQTDNNNFDMSDSFSIETWIVTPTAGRNTTYLLRSNDTDTFMIGQGNSSELYFRASNTQISNELKKKTYTTYLGFTALDISPNTFQHWVFTYDGSMGKSGLKLYINGLLANGWDSVYNTLSNSLTFSNSPWYVGSKGASDNTDYKQGLFRLFNKELSESEITTLWNSGIPNYSDVTTGKVAEYKMSDLTDTYGNTASTSGTLSYIPYSRGFKITPQLNTETGYIFDLYNLGERGAYSGATYNWAPFQEYRNYSHHIFNQNNKTYIGWHIGGKHSYNFENVITRIDHSTNVIDKNLFLGTEWEGERDGHNSIDMIQKKNSTNYIVTQTRWHEGDNSPVVFKEVDTLLRDVTNLTSITPAKKFDYPQLFYLHDTLYCMGRGDTDYSDGSYYKSSDNATTWSTAFKVTEGLVTRSQPQVLKHNDSIAYIMISRINDNTPPSGLLNGGNPIIQFFYMKTRDAIHWYNVDSSYTQDIRDSTINQTVLNANYVVASDSGVDHGYDIHSWDFDDNDNPVFMTYNYSDSLFKFHYYSSGWQAKTVNINKGMWTNYGATWASFGQIVAKGGNNYDLFIGKTIGSDVRLVKYETTDAFTSLSDSTTLSPAGKSIFYPQKTYNIDRLKPITIACCIHTTGSLLKTDMFIYTYTLP